MAISDFHYKVKGNPPSGGPKLGCLFGNPPSGGPKLGCLFGNPLSSGPKLLQRPMAVVT